MRATACYLPMTLSPCTYSSNDRAMAAANDTAFGMSVSFGDARRVRRVMRRPRSGQVALSRATRYLAVPLAASAAQAGAGEGCLSIRAFLGPAGAVAQAFALDARPRSDKLLTQECLQ